MLLAEVAPGSMSNIVSQLNTGVSTTTIFGVVGEIMPFVVTMIIAGLGLYVLGKVVRKAGKGKAGI